MKEIITIPKTPESLRAHPTGEIGPDGPVMSPELSFKVFVEYYIGNLVGFTANSKGWRLAAEIGEAVKDAQPGEQVEVSHDAWEVLNAGLEDGKRQTREGGTAVLPPPFQPPWRAVAYSDAIQLATRKPE